MFPDKHSQICSQGQLLIFLKKRGKILYFSIISPVSLLPQMNDMIRSHLEKIINENNDNSFLILNKTFGNILIKKQQVPKGSDLNGFIIKNVLKVFKRKMKQMDREKKANDIVSTNIDESLFGDDIDDVNQTEAAQYFKMAADHRHVESMFNYSNLIGTCSNSEINQIPKSSPKIKE